MKYSPLLRLSGGLMMWALPTMAWAADAGGTGVLAGIGVGLLVVVAAVVAARPYGMLLAAFSGIGVSAYLAYEHHQVGSTVCDVSSAVSCSNVIKSEYGEIAGVPVALFGVGYFLAMSWLASRYAFQQKAGALALLQVGAVLGVAADVYFGWAMTQVGSLCPFCASTYVLNLVLLVASSLERRGKEEGFSQALPSEGGPAVVIGLAGLIFGLMATGGSGKSVAASGGGKAGTTSLVGMYELPAGTVRYEPNDPVKGNPEAKFILVEWADFQCPHCAATFPELKKVIEENPDVKLYYKHYPISQTCNHFVEWEGHKDSCRAAAASVCANAQNAFWPLAEKMFKNQEYLGKDDLRFMVQQSGLDTVAFEACMADPATEAAVREDVEAGGVAQINGTPSIFLKGPFGDQWVKINGGREEINAILAAARAGQPLPPPPPPSPGR
jgi:protein-disulfide isomerase/uncharacterized membrane protein